MCNYVIVVNLSLGIDFKLRILVEICNKLCPHTLLQDQFHGTTLTLEWVLGLYWLVMLVVQGLKKHFSSALPVLLELFLAITIMMLVFNVLVSIT